MNNLFGLKYLFFDHSDFLQIFELGLILTFLCGLIFYLLLTSKNVRYYQKAK